MNSFACVNCRADGINIGAIGPHLRQAQDAANCKRGDQHENDDGSPHDNDNGFHRASCSDNRFHGPYCSWWVTCRSTSAPVPSISPRTIGDFGLEASSATSDPLL